MKAYLSTFEQGNHCMTAFFINDHPKSPGYEVKKQALLEVTIWNFGFTDIFTERDLVQLLAQLKSYKNQMLFITSLTEFENYAASEISQFIVQAVDAGISVHVINDSLSFGCDALEKEIAEAVAEKHLALQIRI